MDEIMNSPKGVKSGVQERVRISAPHVAPVTIYKKKQLETSHVSQLVNKPFNICDREVSNL